MNNEKHQRAVQIIYKFQLWIFTLVGCWGLWENASQRLQRLYELFYLTVLVFLLLLLDIAIFAYCVKNITDIDEVLSVFFMLATLIASLIKYLTIKLKRRKFRTLFQFLHNDVFAAKNPREENFLQGAFKTIKQLRVGYCSSSLCALILVMFSNLITKSFELPIHMYTPYSLNDNLAFALTYAYEFVPIAMDCLVNIAFDTLCPSMLIFVKVQLEILADRLSHLNETTNGDDEKIHLELKAGMKFYENISLLLRDIEALISIPFSVQLMCSILVLIANFYAISLLSGKSDYSTLFGISIYQCCMLMQIFMICYFANEVTLTSLKVSHALYGTDWMFWNKKNRKLAQVMMECCSVPLRLRSINRNFAFDLEAFTTIVNSSYSYFALLKRVN